MFIQTERATLIVHYYRFDETYGGWNAWAWPEGREGASFPFEERDDFGATAHCRLEHMSGVTRIGLLLRRSTAEELWAEREFDDRYVEEVDERGVAEVWIVEGDERMYTRAERALAYARRRRRIVEAMMTSPHAVDVRLNRLPDGMDEAAAAAALDVRRAACGRLIPLRGVVPLGARTFRALTAEPLDVGERYAVRLPGVPEAAVSLRGMFDSPEFERRFVYDGDDLGAAYAPEATSFRLWAPTAERASLVIYRAADAAAGEERPMEPSANGTWTIRLEGDCHSLFYTYKVWIDDEWREAVDPYARAVSANGRLGAVVDPARAEPDGWAADVRPPFGAPTDAVLYELHVRDATVHPDSGAARPGTYAGLAEGGTRTPDGFATGLDYVTSLGVTHVQLLPVADFVSVDETDPARAYNWGYDPAHWFAPEGSYATDPYDPAVRLRELKALVAAFHRRGIRVSLDVVYNHQFSLLRSSLERLVPGYYFRFRPDGTPANGTGVGNDTASERAMMRKLIVDCVAYWAESYHVDGFRFDLMGIHDVETMRAVRERLDRIDPTILVYGEGWVLDTPLPEERKASLPNARAVPRVGFFHDRFRDGIRGGVFYAEERGFVSGEGARAHDVWIGIVGGIEYGRGIDGHALEPEQTINYAEVHDNHTLWDKLVSSNADDDESARRAMQRLAASVLFTSQGIPLLHAGQEWFRTKGGEHNSYRSPDAVNRLDWRRAERFRGDVDYVRGLIALRRAHAAFRLPTAELVRTSLRIVDTPPYVIAYTLSPPSGDNRLYFVAHNAGRCAAALPLPDAGAWSVLCDGERASAEPIDSFEGAEAVVPPLASVVLVLARE
ncbi:type I pullulanase [Paenibacillus sp.]|uniref:type I pullulanase n=1 Tax=Paenibacillus sp. TaxID=58172 RepID=UPI002D394E5C|nr:type I pullulanase [Paenibacillus sp.]HZG87628.1 type I pullulanase [Paenibacillus sp.]